MKKVLPYLGTALSVLAISWTATAQAQDNSMFEDVKSTHWAYDAVRDLQSKKVIVGYPDHHFNGQRTLTRYEFAVALKRALDQIQATPGPQGPAGPAGPAGADGAVGPAGPAGAPGMTPQEVDELKRLTGEFKNELAALGTSMRDVQSKLDNLSKEVGNINRRLDKMIQFNGDFFVGVRSDQSRNTFADYSGATRIANSSHLNNLTTPHDFHLDLHANLPGGVKFNGDLVSSNYLSYRGQTLAGGPSASTNGTLSQQTSLYQANVVIPVASVGSGTTLTVGRYKDQLTPLTYYRPDYDAYFDLSWYDDGNYVQDGVELKAKFGSVSTKFFGATYSSVVLNNAGSTFNTPIVGSTGGPTLGQGQVRNGALTPGQVYGFHGGIPLFRFGELGLTIIDFSGSSNGSSASNIGSVIVYGANVKLNPIGRLTIGGEASKSVTQLNFDTADARDNEDNNAYNVNVGYNSGPITASAGYQYIDPRFAAPGYWNKIGNWYNPTNVQGPFARIAYKLSDKLNLNIGGDYLTGARNRPGAPLQGLNALNLTQGSSIFRGSAGVRYHLSKQIGLRAEYEGVFFDLSGAVSTNGFRAKPVEQYITVGADLNMTGNTVLKLAYQIVSDSNLGNSNFLTNQGGNANASVFTTQVAVHF